MSETSNKELAEMVSKWRDLRESRLAQDKIAANLKAQETFMKDTIIQTMLAQQCDGVVTGDRVVGVSERVVKTVSDRPAFVGYILEHQALELLEFRPVQAAIEERLEAGEVIPGLEDLSLYNLYDRKV